MFSFSNSEPVKNPTKKRGHWLKIILPPNLHPGSSKKTTVILCWMHGSLWVCILPHPIGSMVYLPTHLSYKNKPFMSVNIRTIVPWDPSWEKLIPYCRHFHHQKSPNRRCSCPKTAGTCRISSGGTPAEAMAEANMEAEAAWNPKKCKGLYGGVSENRRFFPPNHPSLIGFSMIFTIHFGAYLFVCWKQIWNF